jgi:membrane-associated phospholipid phosphatase
MVHELPGCEEMKNMPIKKHIIIFAAIVASTVLSYLFIDIPAAYWCWKLDRLTLDIAEIVTAFGKSTIYLIASFLLYLFFRFYRKKEIYANRSLFVFASVAFSGIFVDLVKWVAGRYRPVMLFDQGLYGFTFFRTGYEWTSFASGHAVTAFSLAIALSVLFPRGRMLFFLAAIAIAASRVLLTAHFLSDFIFGAYIGIISVYLLKAFFDRRGWELK